MSDGLSVPTRTLAHGDGEAGAPLLDEATQLVDAGNLWRIKVFRNAGEAVVWLDRPTPGITADVVPAYVDEAERPLQTTIDDWMPDYGPGRYEYDEVQRHLKNRANAGRRARGRSRRYCKANRLDKLWTLTNGTPVYERAEMVKRIQSFIIELRACLGGKPFPYLWVIEEHESGALHAHLAAGMVLAMRCKRCDPEDVGKGLHRRQAHGAPCLRCCWGHGFVSAERFRKKGRKGGAGAVAGYVAKYVGKDVEQVEKGKKSYDVGQGFQPEVVELELSGSSEDALALVRRLFHAGCPASFTWSSVDVEDWCGPPVRVVFWDSP